MRFKILICVIWMSNMLAWGQNQKEQQVVRQKRIAMIHAHHIGMGVDANMYRNVHLAPRIFYGFGSYRNIFSFDVGAQYTFSHPLSVTNDEKVTAHYIAPFVAANIHFVKWNSGCAYAGAEFAYHFAISGDHYSPSSPIIVRDIHIGNHHSTIRAKAGVRFENWDLNAHFEYDLAPALNQKYIFESINYDYPSLKYALFERWRIGVAIAYLIPF